ncbi:16S rRNA (guanine527-N7)-methyltransferase [Barrientosiimonas humi]|uniref:Ribosomal RNA small subunit methyltransferase G n=1 Tax=Barrientosiimonas humi TaxID=999931 RepID=A0A542XG39_9MICO|nr:16S rRNA (guanine(527)-N(7))-methyltransferase RsmG [Barrientosiimonas humi]TQL34792.1 16S rRNA (guanine527-N7)-methyltransferase [Barrientosiimonas humi]CAG7570897.1 Ribosomal RNA small subunit methyltransferase G [Barrientosiimonas humi]
MEQADASPSGQPPEVAARIFGDRLELATAYVRFLETTGVQHGLIGPREVPRLWDRHVLNCAVIAPAFGPDATVADVGSGAGLPGMVLAIARPDLRVTLVEPLERRTRWLSEVVHDLGLEVTVLQRKAENAWGEVVVDAVTSRAVAQLGELARLSLPLLRPNGRMVALKGERAASELEADAEVLDRLRVAHRRVATYGEGVLDPPSTVVELTLDGVAPQLRQPVGDGPARTAARKKARRAERRRARPGRGE